MQHRSGKKGRTIEVADIPASPGESDVHVQAAVVMADDSRPLPGPKPDQDSAGPTSIERARGQLPGQGPVVGVGTGSRQHVSFE